MSEPGKLDGFSQDLLKRAVSDRFDAEEMILVPLLAVAMALAFGAIVMLATGVSLTAVGQSYVALFTGSLGSINAVSETLTAAAPLTLAALGIALGFRAGLFNIGAEGQVLLGGMAAVVVGFALTDTPAWIHLPLALLAGAIAGAIWAGIAGWLKAATGAHEVITTIMLNLIAMRLVDYLLRNPPVQKPGRADPISQSVLPSAELPRLLSFIDPNLRVHAGILLVIAAVLFVYWLLFRTTTGFEFRAAGSNPDAARYAGMKSGMIIVLVMATAGALAGLAGANQVLGVLGRASPGFSGGAGFDAIAVALLGRSHPVGVLLAGLLFGALQAGGREMQVEAGVSIDLIAIIQALVIVFMAAPTLVRATIPWVFRKEAGR
ncbi:MAG: ABC transporter permease [Bauldia sp.]|uniref:ABC transporter permease n=1 Tax=Bauldia sp. TaxID=2575872 RepID=UPI001D42C393|nr:ABC transporter permease [Bauldia sp.]MCB1497058.1 ABC transporter permease [Bauldia sp.]